MREFSSEPKAVRARERRAGNPVIRQKERESSKKYSDANPQVVRLRALRSRAKRRGLEFDLTLEDIAYPASCPILGIPLEPRRGQRGPSAQCPSVDRLDNSRGYTRDNIRVISYKANRLKSDMTVEQCERLLAYMKGEL